MATSFRCDNHPPMTAKFHCTRCRKNICNLCLNNIAGRPTCGACGADLAEAPQTPKPRNTVVAGADPVAPGSKLLSRMRSGGTGPVPTAAPSGDAPATGNNFLNAVAQGGATATAAAAAPATPAAAVADACHDNLNSGVNKGHVRCKNHPELPAGKHCQSCNIYLCRDCVKKDAAFGACPQCGGKVSGLSPQEQGIAVKPLSVQLPAAFVYPFTGDGLWMLILGGFFFFALGFGGWRGSALAAAIITAYMMKIIRTSSVGKDLPPSWPSFNYEELAQPLWHSFVCSLVVMAPAFLFLIFLGPGMSGLMEPDELSAAAAEHDEGEIDDFHAIMEDPSGFDLTKREKEREHKRRVQIEHKQAAAAGVMVVFFLLLLVGSVFWPMCFLGVTLFRDLSALNPLFVLGSIARIGTPYYYAAGLMVGVLIVEYAGGKIDEQIPIIGRFFATFISLYAVMVKSRMLGIVYYVKQKELGWFV